jgi:hypothetical protein
MSEIEAKIYERYPKTQLERHCALERERLKGLREAYRKRLETDITTNTETEARKEDEPL